MRNILRNRTINELSKIYRKSKTINKSIHRFECPVTVPAPCPSWFFHFQSRPLRTRVPTLGMCAYFSWNSCSCSSSISFSIQRADLYACLFSIISQTSFLLRKNKMHVWKIQAVALLWTFYVDFALFQAYELLLFLKTWHKDWKF